ncbi:hypothetical protein NP233_g8599 [Leucocoprinus birnbaumii]|uniref:Uncharacterized protein n=1 Tax=Leucocoprinus birnbaumii TaxID=56174 RepID=A0AAD5VQM1_9AGAR|nr:hypothetical protein NP233_g8599 [Leucocoprinus birnbaumii]
MALVFRQTHPGAPVAVLNPPIEAPTPPSTSAPPPPTTIPPSPSVETTTVQPETPLSTSPTDSPAQSPFAPSSISSLSPSSISSLKSATSSPKVTIMSAGIVPSSPAANVASSTKATNLQVIIPTCVGGVLMVIALVIVGICCARKKNLKRIFRRQRAVDMLSADVENTTIMAEKQDVAGMLRMLESSSNLWLPPNQPGLHTEKPDQPPSSNGLIPLPLQPHTMGQGLNVRESIPRQNTTDSLNQAPNVIQGIPMRLEPQLPTPPIRRTTIHSSKPTLIRFPSSDNQIIPRVPAVDLAKGAQAKEDTEPPRNPQLERQLLMTLMHRFDALEAAIRDPRIGSGPSQVPFHGKGFDESPPSYVAHEERDAKETRLAWDGRRA